MVAVYVRAPRQVHCTVLCPLECSVQQPAEASQMPFSPVTQVLVCICLYLCLARQQTVGLQRRAL